MTCENCVARVLRYVNDIDGVVGKVNLRKKNFGFLWNEKCLMMKLNLLLQKLAIK